MPSAGPTLETLRDFVRDNLWDGITVKDVRRIDRAIKNGLERAAQEHTWPWMRVNHFRALTIAPYGDEPAIAMSVSGSAGGTTITGSGTTFTAAMEGRYIKFEGLEELYQIKTFTNTTTIVLHDALRAAVTAGSGFLIHAIKYDLPNNFGEIRRVVDLTRRTDSPALAPVDDDQFETLLATYHHAGGFPDVYAVVTKRDSSVYQLGLMPPPTDARYYQVHYIKQPGWFNATTNAFEVTPTAATSIVDWPVQYRGLLERALLLAAAAEWKIPQWQQQANFAFNDAVDVAKKRCGIDLDLGAYGEAGAGMDPQRRPRFIDPNGNEIG